MRAHVIGVLALLGVLAAGCASSQLDRRFAAGNYAEVVRIFESDSSLQVREDALYRAGIAYGMPDSPVHDPARAIETLDRLLFLFPGSGYRQHALQLRRVLGGLAAAEQRQMRRDEEVADLTHRVRGLEERIAELETALEQERTRARALRAIADRLDRDVRTRDQQIQALQAELAALKEIDLNRAPPRDVGTGGTRH